MSEVMPHKHLKLSDDGALARHPLIPDAITSIVTNGGVPESTSWYRLTGITTTLDVLPSRF